MSSKRFKAVVMMLAVLALGSILLAACVRPGTTTTTSTGGGSTATSTPSGGGGGGGSGNCANGTVQTGASTFIQSCVTVAKGASLKIVPAAQSLLHVLTNGSWVGSNAQLAKEPGAPSIDNVNVTNASVEIGPFTTAGTFHILCTVHPGMNLTIEVK
jgi:plastocyanin